MKSKYAKRAGACTPGNAEGNKAMHIVAAEEELQRCEAHEAAVYEVGRIVGYVADYGSSRKVAGSKSGRQEHKKASILEIGSFISNLEII